MNDHRKDGQAMPANEPEHLREGAADRAHRTHGKGDSREVLHQTPNAAAPDASQDGSTRSGGVAGGNAAWGDAANGGSTVDRRSEPRGKDKKKAKKK